MHHRAFGTIEPIVGDDAVPTGQHPCRERSVSRAGLGSGVRIMAIRKTSPLALESLKSIRAEAIVPANWVIAAQLIERDQNDEFWLPRRVGAVNRNRDDRDG